LRIIVGLGNPGARYAATRHNIGWVVVDAVALKCRAKVTKSACRALIGFGRAAGREVLLAKPQTFMNLSGESVAGLLKYTGADHSGLIVVHDDLDLPLGGIRIRKSGGDGGHNGVSSLITELGTGAFVRVRIGIGRPPLGVDPAEYVLTPFGQEELEVVEEAVGRAAEAVITIIAEGPDKAMNRFNRAAGQTP
jgi:PTH1 family peptidyl-tRNA hydrolase